MSHQPGNMAGGAIEEAHREPCACLYVARLNPRPRARVPLRGGTQRRRAHAVCDEHATVGANAVKQIWKVVLDSPEYWSLFENRPARERTSSPAEKESTVSSNDCPNDRTAAHGSPVQQASRCAERARC